MLTMGGDFQYQNARINYKNIDKLIEYVNSAAVCRHFYALQLVVETMHLCSVLLVFVTLITASCHLTSSFKSLKETQSTDPSTRGLTSFFSLSASGLLTERSECCSLYVGSLRHPYQSQTITVLKCEPKRT